MVKVGAKALCRFEKVTALEVIMGNVNVGSLRLGQVQRGLVEKVHSPKGANSGALYVAVGTFTAFMWQSASDHVWERICEGVNVELVE